MNIVVEVDGQALPATLDDTAAGRAFAEMLPLTLSLGDFGGGVEKVADLPGPLPTNDAPSGMKPVAGDITYYSPWGNLAIFRKGFSHASGLVKLGRFTSGFDAIDRSGSITVTIKAAE
ncbi:cyclophilin-like fold protein [Salinicola avicenniae]|uniref:cyclophilin-like fold protein n=1 Tax=Salinicola avicenniae TaxID=2916836 RepID=UPI002074094A|nr:MULTISPECIES: cyclophilin-like fold protein [unclassified Salinicola]